MAIKHDKPNALSYFKMRRVNFACPYFTYTTISPSSIQLESIVSWIEENLNSRYYIEKGISISTDPPHSIQYNFTVGFESPGELTFFNLGFLNNNQ